MTSQANIETSHVTSTLNDVTAMAVKLLGLVSSLVKSYNGTKLDLLSLRYKKRASKFYFKMVPFYLVKNYLWETLRR